MIFLQDGLIEFFMSFGASRETAENFATPEFAKKVSDAIERDRRDMQIRDLFPQIGADGISERFGIHRVTAYRILKKVA